MPSVNFNALSDAQGALNKYFPARYVGLHHTCIALCMVNKLMWRNQTRNTGAKPFYFRTSEVGSFTGGTQHLGTMTLLPI